MTAQAKTSLKDNWECVQWINEKHLKWVDILNCEGSLIQKGVKPCDYCLHWHVQLTLKHYRELLSDNAFHEALKATPPPKTARQFFRSLMKGESAMEWIAIEGRGLILECDTITIEVVSTLDPKDPKWGACPLKSKKIDRRLYEYEV